MNSVSGIIAQAKRDGIEWVFIDTPPGPSAYMQQALTAAQVVVVVNLPDAASYAALALMQRLVHTYCTPRPDFAGTLHVLNQADGARQCALVDTGLAQHGRQRGVLHGCDTEVLDLVHEDGDGDLLQGELL